MYVFSRAALGLPMESDFSMYLCILGILTDYSLGYLYITLPSCIPDASVLSSCVAVSPWWQERWGANRLLRPIPPPVRCRVLVWVSPQAC